MPPKPWETSTTTAKSTIDTSEIITGSGLASQNSLNRGENLDLTSNTTSLSRNMSTPTGTSGYDTGYNSTSTYSPYSSGYGSYGSGYGGYGGGYSSYGSGYGGYGGGYSSYGSGYGSYGGYGGYGGYGSYGYGRGMYGRGMGPDGKGNLMEFAIRYLDSFSYGIHSLCEMTRNIEMNAEGLNRFWHSISNLFMRFIAWIGGTGRFCKETLQMIVSKFKQIFSNKAFLSGLLLSEKTPKVKLYNILLRVCLILFAVTFLAPLAKAGKIKG